MVKGTYFGEIDIIEKQRRGYTVIATEICDTVTLTKQIYENVIVKEYPEIDAELRYTSILRISKLKEAEMGLIKERLAVTRRLNSSKMLFNLVAVSRMTMKDNSHNYSFIVSPVINNASTNTEKQGMSNCEITSQNDSSDYLSESEEEKFRRKIESRKHTNNTNNEDVLSQITEEFTKIKAQQEVIIFLFRNLFLYIHN
jgi:CRP-like cAMP-binding protein